MKNEEERIRERFGFAAALELSKEEAEEFAEGLPPKSKALFLADLADLASTEVVKPRKKRRFLKTKT